MSSVTRSITVPYSNKLLYSLVNDVEKYPQFVDWCVLGEEVARTGDTVTAALTFEFHGVKHTFTTENQLLPYERIDIALIDGPFEHLDGHWLFKSLSDDWTEISLNLDFEFNIPGLSLVFETIFASMANHWIEAFCARAKDLADAD